MNDADAPPLRTSPRPLRHFLWAFVLAIVLPGVLSGVALVWWTAQQLVEHQEQDARGFSATAADNIGNYLKTLSTGIAVRPQRPLGSDPFPDSNRASQGFAANEGYNGTPADGKAIANVLSGMALPDGWLIGQIDGHGNFIARSKDPEQWIGKPTRPDMVDAAHRSVSGMVYNKSVEGIPVLNVFNRVPGTDWSILVGIPESVLYAPVRRPVALLVGLLLLATALAIALALEFQWRFHAATTQLLAIARDPLHRYERAPATATIAFAEFEAVAQILTTNAGIHQQLITELSESAKRYRATLSALSEGVVTHGRDGTIIACNPAAERILGLSAAQLMGVKDPDPSRQYLHEDGTPFPLETHPSAQVLRTGLAHPNVVMGIVTSDGVPTWILVNAMPMFNPGEPLPAFVVVSFSDITERRHAETRLEVKREKLAAVFENSAVGFILSDAQGRRVSMNATAVALIGYPRKEDLQRSAEDAMGNWGLHYGDGRPLQFDEWPLVRAVRGDFVRNVELHGRNTSSGKAWVCKLTTAPVSDPAGKLNFILQTLFDITKTKRLEQALLVRNADLQRATKAAESASLAKSNFLSCMSHELRTPLNAILGFAQLMETSATPPTPAQKRSIDQILSAGWHLLELVNDILDLAQIESGRVAMACEAVSLEQVLSRCQAMVEPLAHKRGIGMRFPRLEQPLFIEGDPTRIKQVLINLVYNAVKYNQPAGMVTVECNFAPHHSIRISVRDTGAGLTAEQLSQLFQPFNRLGQEAGPVTGTGVGLVVSKRLVERMGGAIGADSTVGVGSVFWIELRLTFAPPPAVVWAPPAAPARPLPLEGTVPKTVLYVEDNPANLELVEALMERRLDLRLITAGDGNLGVEYARTYLPEVILMDLHLPGISGIEAMNQLQADALTADIPVIALSAYALPGDIEKALEAGFISYLTKPIVLNEFMAALNVALEFSHRKSTRSAPLPETSDS